MSDGRAAASTTAWWRGAVIYQVYPRSYQDSTGNGIGDLPGITRRLDHIASLGVDAVWVSPFFPSPMADFGYDVSDFCGVDPLFGSLDDFDALVSKAHGLGLKVLVDQVYSHSSDQHPWFQESRQSRDNPKADWYVWADAKADGSPPTNWQSVFTGPAWTWDARRQQYYLHNFLSAQPDLNVRNPEVQEAILAVARFWFERGADGLRLDALNFMMHDPALPDNPPAHGHPARRPFDYQQRLYNRSHPDILAFTKRLRALADEYGDTFLMAEIGDSTGPDEALRYIAGDEQLHSAYSFVFLEAEVMSAPVLKQELSVWAAGDGWPSWTFSNHDVSRAVSRWHRGDDPRYASVIVLLLLCLRGTAILYQGEELGLPQADIPFEALRDPEAIANWPLTKGRDGARTPMVWEQDAPFAGFSETSPWLPVDPRHPPLAVDRQNAHRSSVLQATRHAIRLRRENPVIFEGEMDLIDSGHDDVILLRHRGEVTLLCVFNLSEEKRQVVLPPAFDLAQADSIDNPALKSPAIRLASHLDPDMDPHRESALDPDRDPGLGPHRDFGGGRASLLLEALSASLIRFTTNVQTRCRPVPSEA